MTKYLELRDNAKEGQREPNSKSPLKNEVSNDKKLTELFERLRENPEEVDAITDFLRQRDATSSFAQAATADTPPPFRPADTPPLWAARTTGREVSPIAWIKMYYQPWLESGTLSRPLLGRLDPVLYEAYAKWSKRNPTLDDLKIPTKSQVVDKNAVEFGILSANAPSGEQEGRGVDYARTAVAIAMRSYRMPKK